MRIADERKKERERAKSNGSGVPMKNSFWSCGDGQ
jgi:hypothetical protein